LRADGENAAREVDKRKNSTGILSGAKARGPIGARTRRPIGKRSCRGGEKLKLKNPEGAGGAGGKNCRVVDYEAEVKEAVRKIEEG